MTPNYSRASTMAYRTLTTLHISALPVDPMQILSFCKNVVVRTYEEITPMFSMADVDYFRWMHMDNRDAVTIRQEFPDGRAVYEVMYDHRTYGPRQRFTMAHELGHIILKHRMEEEWEEREADYFASQLLAPRPLFVPMKEVGINVSDPSVISDIFSISKSAGEMCLHPLRHCPVPELSDQLCQQFSDFIRMKGGSMSA